MKNSKTILLIEDNDAHARLTKIAFKAECIGFDLVHILDGQEALNWLEKTKNENLANLPKFILLDLNLPTINGIEVLKAIKQDAILSLIPIITLTTSTSNNDIKTCYENKVNSYIVKPLSYEEYVKIAEMLRDYWILTNRSVDINYLI